MLVPLLLSVVLAMYIIPRILMVSVKKDLNLPPRLSDKGKRAVPRLGGVSLFPILIISVGAGAVFCMMQDWQTVLQGDDEETFVQYMFAMAGLTTMYLLGVMDDLIGVSFISKLAILYASHPISSRKSTASLSKGVERKSSPHLSHSSFILFCHS